MTDLAADLAQLARDGVDPDLIGQAYGARAYPGLDRLAPLGAYGLGFRDGARAVLPLILARLAGTLDDAEVIARLCDPDVLPLPPAPPAAEPAEA